MNTVVFPPPPPVLPPQCRRIYAACRNTLMAFEDRYDPDDLRTAWMKGYIGMLRDGLSELLCEGGG
jgi:hypothetical protein